jgi:hypothetical protein
MSTEIEAVEGTSPAQPFVVAHRRALVIGSRTAMLMLLIAALAVLGLGILALVRGGGPEVEGVLRTLFGQVFAVVAGAMAAILGIPAAIGMAAMAGSTADGAVPALSSTPRRVLVGVALATIGVAALAVVTGGTPSLLVNLGLLGLAALALLGLAGAASFSPHRIRAILAGVALLAVAAGTLWVILTVGR